MVRILRLVARLAAATVVLLAGCGDDFADRADEALQDAEANVDALVDELGLEELDRHTRTPSNREFGFQDEHAWKPTGRVQVDLQGAARGDDPEYLESVRAAIVAAGYVFIADGCNLNDASAVVANPSGEAILVVVRPGSGRITLETEIDRDHQQYSAADFEFSPDVPGCWPDIN